MQIYTFVFVPLLKTAINVNFDITDYVRLSVFSVVHIVFEKKNNAIRYEILIDITLSLSNTTVRQSHCSFWVRIVIFLQLMESCTGVRCRHVVGFFQKIRFRTMVTLERPREKLLNAY